MSNPVLVAVEDDADALRDLERELRDRYARHYRVVCMRSPHEARARLEDLAAAGDEVALVLAGQQLSGTTGSELLDETRHVHPYAKRGLLIRLRTVASTITWSDHRHHRTSSFIRRSRACCSSGQRPSTSRQTRST